MPMDEIKRVFSYRLYNTHQIGGKVGSDDLNMARYHNDQEKMIIIQNLRRNPNMVTPEESIMLRVILREDDDLLDENIL